MLYKFFEKKAEEGWRYSVDSYSKWNLGFMRIKNWPLSYPRSLLEILESTKYTLKISFQAYNLMMNSINGSCNFDKKQRLKTNFLTIKLYIGLIHGKIHFQKWRLAWISQIYSFIDKIFLFDLWFLSKLELCLTFWW